MYLATNLSQAISRNLTHYVRSSSLRLISWACLFLSPSVGGMSQSSISDITNTDQGRFSIAAPAVGTSQSSMSSVTGQTPFPNGTQATLVPDSNVQIVLQVPALPIIVEARRRSRSPNSRSSPHTAPRSKSPRRGKSRGAAWAGKT